jgi:hypothetical protein
MTLASLLLLNPKTHKRRAGCFRPRTCETKIVVAVSAMLLFQGVAYQQSEVLQHCKSQIDRTARKHLHINN